MTLKIPRSEEADRALAVQAEVDGQVEFWMRVARAAKLNLPALARLGTERMAALALEHAGYRVVDHAKIATILREPEFES